MHEMGIAEQLVQIALDAIPPEIENPRVEKLNLKIGKLSAVVAHSLTFCFEVIAKDTPLEGAVLEIETVPVMVQCLSCNARWEVAGPEFRCPDCKVAEVKMVSGREIEITSLELAQ